MFICKRPVGYCTDCDGQCWCKGCKVEHKFEEIKNKLYKLNCIRSKNECYNYVGKCNCDICEIKYEFQEIKDDFLDAENIHSYILADRIREENYNKILILWKKIKK